MEQREVLDWSTYGRAARALAQQVADDGYEPDIILAIARGGLFVAGSLGYALSVKNLYVMNVEFYTGVDERLDVPVMLPPYLELVDLHQSKVLITDDVADTGATLAHVHEHCTGKVGEVRSAVLYEKPPSIIKCEYVWKHTDRWINFPWSTEPPVIDLADARADTVVLDRVSDELARVDAMGQAELVRSGEVSPAELTEAAIARIEALNPALNAVIHPTFEKARAAAGDDLPDGPFRGVPMLLKDLWPASAGDPFHLGIKALKDADHRHPDDSNITTAYRDAGFVLCGRTNTPELGLVATTEPLAHGPSRNPWNTDHGTGGSSGGAAAAVAAGMVPAANASDGGGSIRIPAAMCGLVGLKPSRGRISMGPMQDEWGVSVQHVVSHTVRDSAAIMDATAHPFPGDGVIAPTTGQPYRAQVGTDPGRLRIGFVPGSLRDDIPTDPDVVTASRDAAHLLERLGHDVTEAHPEVLTDDALAADFTVLWTVGARANLTRIGQWLGRELGPDDVEPATWVMAEMAAAATGEDVVRAQGAQHVFRRRMAEWWAGGFDLLLTPTCLRTAPPIGELASTPDEPLRGFAGSLAYAAFTSPFNVTGQPAISLPLAHSSDDLPIGIQLVADYAREDVLFAIAGQLEAEVRWADRRAPLHP